MNEQKCPNCSAMMQLSKSKTKWVCPYCQAEIENGKKEASELPEEMFSIEKDLSENSYTGDIKESLSSFKYCFREIGTAEKVEEYIRKSMAGIDCFASEGINQKFIDIAKERLQNELEAGERIIVYADTGLIFKGKEYFLLTDKRCFFVKKKKFFQIYHKDITVIKFETGMSLPTWRLNSNLDTSVSWLGSKYTLQGAIAALICLLSFKNDPDRERIRII